MTLTAGTRLGPYEIVAATGAGGMGDVYRARDVRLDRDVAVKTIKGPFTERFEREARAISALNHPNICTLHDVGEHEGSGYLVLEYIDGKPIAGPLPVDQAVGYGIQICEALHAAHRKGIVHRDLKPANILLTKQGVKLLDFGLAKLGPAANSVVATSGAGAEQATMAALTGAHTVVGTPQYMAPEQIEGREVDARTDIFAFGCVLYELLTGRRAFEGKTSSSVMASVLATQPAPLEQLVPLTPPALERIVSRCMAKDPEDRWQTARDVAAELQWVQQGGSKVGLPVMVTKRRRSREGLAWGAFGLAVVAAAALGYAWWKRAPEPPALMRFTLTTPPTLTNLGSPAISPNGRHVAFAATDAEGKRRIWIRSLDSVEPRVLAGTDGALRPFWSPDSRFVGYTAGGKVKKADIAGGPPQVLCDLQYGADGSWSSQGVILVDGRGNDPIWRVPAGGGEAKVEVSGDPSKGLPGAGWPQFLPDGKHFLYTRYGGGTAVPELTVGALDSKDATPLFRTASRVEYAEPGYLLFVREQTLVAQKFDARTLKLEGEAVPVSEGLGIGDLGLASFSASRTGILVFRPGNVEQRQLVWYDRAGKETPAIEEAGDFSNPSLSADGTRLAFDRTDGNTPNLWIRDIARGVTSRFTFEQTSAVNAQWSPDGRRIAFTATPKGPPDLYVKDTAGTREPELLVASPEPKYLSDWSPDGKYLIYSAQASDTGWDVWALPVAGDRKPIALAKSRFDEMFATISPNGKYLAYWSNESGRSEVYVQEFPEARSKWQVSTDGGVEPFWRRDGRELFYRNGTRIMAVPVETGATFTAGTPSELFKGRFATLVSRARYRPSADGQRFLAVVTMGQDAVQPASVVVNWTAALRD
jgi:Tol biopolymer transport system component